MSVPSNEEPSENEAAQIYYLDGNFGIGTHEPKAKLHISVGGGFGDLKLFSPKEPGADFAYDGGSDNVFYFDNYGADSGTTNFRHGNRDLLVIKNDGNVGVGTSTPSQRFHVAGGNGVVNNVFLGDVGHGPDWAGFSHASATSGTAYGFLHHNSGQYALINKRSGGGHIGFRIDNHDKMIISDGGNVGIGTVNMTSKLHVAGNAGVLSLEGTDHVYIQWYPDGINAGRKAWMGFGDVNSEHFVIHNEFPNRGVIFLGNIGTNGYDPYGGGHYPSNWGGGIHTWDVVCEATVGYSGLHQWSSIREKENIDYLGNVLDRIEALNPACFDRKPGYHNQCKGNLGFIAEEVKDVFPELVHADEQDDFFATSVRTDGILALAIAGIKELSQQLRSLQSALCIETRGHNHVSRQTSLKDCDTPVEILRESTCFSRDADEEQYVLVRFQSSADGVNQVQCTRAYQIPNGMPKALFLQEKYNDWCKKLRSKGA